ncbi:MAG: response regulator [Chloroflexota bacterium]
MDGNRLLVVDDDPESLDIVSEALVDQGYAISMAMNEDEASRAIAEARPSLVLLYIGRPGTDQHAVVRQMRERALDLPILVFGGGPAARTAAEQIGAIDYVADPLDLDALVRSLEQVYPFVHE